MNKEMYFSNQVTLLHFKLRLYRITWTYLYEGVRRAIVMTAFKNIFNSIQFFIRLKNMKHITECGLLETDLHTQLLILNVRFRSTVKHVSLTIITTT